jgi:hypothetical protein
MKLQSKQDAIEIVRRLKERNPEFIECIKDETITLEDFAEIVIQQFIAFGNLKREQDFLPDKNVKVPKFVYLTEGYDPKKCDKLNQRI